MILLRMNDFPVPALPVMKMFLPDLKPSKILTCSELKTLSEELSKIDGVFLRVSDDAS